MVGPTHMRTKAWYRVHVCVSGIHTPQAYTHCSVIVTVWHPFPPPRPTFYPSSVYMYVPSTLTVPLPPSIQPTPSSGIIQWTRLWTSQARPHSAVLHRATQCQPSPGQDPQTTSLQRTLLGPTSPCCLYWPLTQQWEHSMKDCILAVPAMV